MCPACIATATLIVAGATSAGGLTALAMKKLRVKAAKSIDPTIQTRGGQDESSKAERWTVGVTAHHLASALESVAGMVTAIVSGQSLGHFAGAMLDEMNATHAKEHANCTRAETIALLKKGAAAAAAAEEHRDLMGVDLIVFGVAPMDRLHIESVAQDNRDPFLDTQVSNPVPGKDTFDRHNALLAIGCNHLQQGVWAGWHVTVHPDVALLVEDADVYGPGVQVDAPVKLMLRG